MFGELISTIGNMFMQDKANRANRDAASIAFDRSMQASSTAHQRQVKDLQAAGLNPILSANDGASAPQASQSEAKAPQIDLPSIIQAKSVNAQIRQTDERIGLEKAANTAAITKNLSDAEVNRLTSVQKKLGKISEWTGTDLAQKANSIKPFKSIPDKFKNAQEYFRKNMHSPNSMQLK